MKKLTTLTVIALCLVLVAGTAMAAKTITAKRIGDAVVTGTNATPKGDCVVGNLGAAAWALSGWMTGDEGYKYYFNAAAQNCCAVGFEMEAVHMLLQFSDPLTLPQTFTVYGDLEEAVWDPALGCWVPGPELCVGEAYTITISDPGLYDISVPLVCECAGSEWDYFLSVHFVGAVDASIIVDDTPTARLDWHNWGTGRVDLADYGLDAYGDLVMWADVFCCSPPVSTEDSTWGEIRNLFR